MGASVMIAKFANNLSMAPSEFHDLNRTSEVMFLVSLMMPKFARHIAASRGELRHRDTSAMIAKFANSLSMASSDFHDRNRITHVRTFDSSERTRISSSGH